jgi:virginiamycin B lyase
MPNEAARDPHTVVEDGNGNIWFTVQFGNFVGPLNTAIHRVRLIPVPPRNARPYGIISDPQGRPWIALLDTNKLATIEPVTMKLTEIDLSEDDAQPRRVGRTSDGQIWYVDHAQGYLSRYNPRTKRIRER